MIRTAAIMARGLGTRMRRRDAAALVDGAQAMAADSGVKGMIPIGRPFLEYIISALADAGISHVVLVLGPEHDAVRDHFTVVARVTRVRVTFALQSEPRGTANAVVAAAQAIDQDSFLVLNADNYYPIEALRALAAEERAATIAFDREALVRDGNIDVTRLQSFAVLTVSDDGQLLGIVEKPGDALDVASPAARWVGMNCWAITPDLVAACRRVPQSTRGEFELPEAVAMALREGVYIRAVRMAAPVLDLSSRADIASVAERLATLVPVL